MKNKIRGFSGTPWPQYLTEINAFIDLLKESGVTSYLEVGCRHGDTFHAVGLALPKGSLLVAVDLPGARSGKATGGKFPNSHKALYKAAADLKQKGQKTVVIIGDSHSPQTIGQVFPYSPFDAVFIDGDHTNEGVRADWRDYGPMGAMVAFHDISSKVGPFYNELTHEYKHREFAFYEKGGIGVIWTDSHYSH